MPTLKYILGVLSIVGGATVTLFAVVSMMAGAANLKGEDLASHDRWTWAVGVGGVAACVAAVVLLILHQPLAACAVGLVPVAFVLGCLIWVTLS